MNKQRALAAVRRSFADGRNALAGFVSEDANMEAVSNMASILIRSFTAGNKTLACGNGGSACDAIHFAEEFTGRYRKDRKALPVIPLLEASHLTCVGNDYGFDEVFARGVQAYGKPGDVLVGISTSGNSRNIIRAVQEARKSGLHILLFLGRSGGELRGSGDAEIIIKAETTDRIQEIHMMALHILIECVERELFPENYSDGDPQGKG